LIPSGEVKNPARTVPRSAYLALVITTIIYIMIQLVAQGTLGSDLANHPTAPLAESAALFLGNIGRTILLAGATISAFGFVTSDILSSPRMLFAFGRDAALQRTVEHEALVSLVERAVFQRVLGESDLRLRAARGLIIEIFEKAWETVCAGRTPEPQLQVEMRSATTLVTEVALEVTTQAFRYGAGTAVHLDNILQRCLRDLQVGASHLMVSDSAYELHGQCLLGIPGVNPMG
jgi:alkylation response protein AidB-like acyl-CoA dehydrogenase